MKLEGGTRRCSLCRKVPGSGASSSKRCMWTEAGRYLKQDPSSQKLIDMSEPHDGALVI